MSQLDERLWDIVVAPSKRGMAELRDELPADLFTAAAGALLECGGPIAIGTGFPIGGPPETDGPPGAFALARALAVIGIETRIVSWPAALQIFSQVEPTLNFEPLDASVSTDGEPPHAAFVAIEICGRAGDGTYRDMRGNDISHIAPRFENVFGERALVAIGDGGNEFGMGKISGEFMQRWDLRQPISTCAHLLPGAVSNFAAYALVKALERIAGTRLLPDPPAHLDTIRALVAAGCVDGVTKQPVEKVDGLPLSATRDILVALRDLDNR